MKSWQPASEGARRAVLAQAHEKKGVCEGMKVRQKGPDGWVLHQSSTGARQAVSVRQININVGETRWGGLNDGGEQGIKRGGLPKDT